VRWLVFAIVLRAAVAHACGGPPEYPYDDGTCGPYEPWSFAPIATVEVAYSANTHTQALVAGELRLRHNHYQDPDAITLALRVASANFETLEPAALLGYDFIDPHFGYSGGHLAKVTHLAIGGGYEHQAFATAQLSVGMMFDRESDGIYHGGPCMETLPCESTRRRHGSQIDIVLEGQVTRAGDVRLSVGIDLDPIRIWHDLRTYLEI
jgi:hypothetical protein